MKERSIAKVDPAKGRWLRVSLATALGAGVLVLAGCLGTGKPAPPLTAYELYYSPPSFPDRAPLDLSVTVQFLAGSQSLAGTDMLYQTAPYRLNSYNYDRWSSPPADLVAGLVARDLSQSRLIRAAFTATTGMDSRFLLQGTVLRFLEVDDGKRGVAHVEVVATLVDTRTTAGGRAILFQKAYRGESAMPAQTGGGLADGMSSAVAQVSKSLIDDLYQTLASYHG